MNTFIKYLSISLALLVIGSCSNGDSSAVREQARESLRDIPPGSVPAPITPGASTPSPASPSGVSHYICPNNCEGSGAAAAGTCPVCGTTYEHNQAYHDQPGGGQPPITTTPGGITPGVAPGATTPPTTLEPPQNAAGVWHYTCSSGCSGGGGSAGKCATCGGDLAHNAAYHN